MVESVKIAYSAAATRVRCEFSRSLALTQDAPPDDILKRVKAKMDAVKSTGEIAFYVTYERRFLDCWTALRQAEDSAGDRIVTLTLAAGSPDLTGLIVEPVTSDKAIITIATATPATRTETWKWEWFKLWIRRRVLELGIKSVPNSAQLYGAFLKLKLGNGLDPYAVSAAPTDTTGKSISVVGNKQRKEIGVIIRNIADLRDRVQRDHMLTLINQAVKQMSVDGVEFHMLKKDFLLALQSSLDGPEGLGLELPVSLLAATGAAHGAAIAASARPSIVGNDLIKFKISTDQMEATITGFNKKIYDNDKLFIDVDWVKEQMVAAKITMPMAESLEPAIAEAIRKLADLNDLVVCIGRQGSGGKAPYLHPTYKDAASRVKGNINEGQLDIRMMQQRSTAVAGQVVAEIRYHQEPVPPRNVFNEAITVPPSERLEVHVGEGIVQRGTHEFVAQVDGIPVIDGLNISLSSALVHEGDVNLSTGNIIFDGPIEINGNVETGATIQTSGNLTVHGTITGAHIHIKGDLKVDAGITTGTTGSIEVRGSITAQFIEQATIICRGNINVQKAIMNSHIFCSGTVNIGPTGVISGGKLFSLGSLITGSLGTARGSITNASVGVDWKVARSIDIKQRRLEKLKKRLADDRLALRDLTQKKPAQMTPKHREQKDELQARLPRLRTMTETLEQLISSAAATVTYNATSRIIVKEVLFANVHITVGGQIVPIVNDVREVAINPKRIRGSYVSPLDDEPK